MREFEGETYLTLAEVTKQYNWQSSTIYYFRTIGLLKSYRFTGDKRSYWKVSELEAVKNRPPTVSEAHPKENRMIALNQHAV